MQIKNAIKKKILAEMLEDIPPDIIRAKGFTYWGDPEHPMVLLNRVVK
ncbi:MAG: hypothetical protein QNJ22_23345 [Desulfosarcinaceae bacterium]|nr:hypothetical protein [Desulfosarcinaceae bacterium]